MGDNKSQNDNSLMKYWRDKLEWYKYKANEEEYNEEEVRALTSVLEIMESEELDESYYNAEKSRDRFGTTLNIRLKIQEEMQKVKDRLVAKKNFTFRPRGLYRVAMAASLVAMLIIGGTVGSYAQKRADINNFKNSQEELQAMVNPPGSYVNLSKTFEDFNKFPMKYLNYVWTPTGIPVDVKLNAIELVEDEAAISIRCEFFNQDTKQFFNVTKKTFVDKVATTNRIYDGFEVCKDAQYNTIDVRFFKKVNEDYTEYIVLFIEKNSIYVINSNCEFETIESIVAENIIDDNL